MKEPVVRPMGKRDLPEVMKVDAESLPWPWSEGLWRAELRSPFGLHLVLEKDGSILGHIGVKRVADELHVVTIAVRPEHRRRGYARALVRAALARHPGARSVYLEVRPSNTAARTLYGSLGFVETGRRPRYYGDEDALLMTLDLRRTSGGAPGGAPGGA